MKIEVTLQQLVQLMLEHEELNGDRHVLAQCLEEITECIVFCPENASAREWNVKQYIQASVKLLRSRP